MVRDQDMGWDLRYYDSYRPAAEDETSSEDRSSTIATESKAVRHHSHKIWQRAEYSSNTTPRADASLALKFSRGQSDDHSAAAASVPNEKSPSTGHDPKQLIQMPTKERKDTSMPDTAPSRRSSRTVDPDRRNASEAQSRGFYGSSPPPSNVFRLGGYELKRPLDDEAIDRSIKRHRGTEEEEEEEEEPIRTSDHYRPPPRYWCKNYMCMEDHAYSDCDKPMICWGCRSISHYWTRCPMTCTRCGEERHTAKHCEDFELTQSGKSRPRACNPHPLTEPASYRARKESLEHAHGKDSLPKKPVNIVLPSRDRPEVRQASRNVFDPRSGPRQGSQPQKSAPVEECVSETTTDRELQRLRDTPIPGSSLKGRTSTTSTSEQLTILTQARGKTFTPPSTQPNISPRDPRLKRGSALTPLVSPLQSLRTSLEPGEVVSVEPKMLGEPPSNPSQHRPHGVGATPSQASVRQEEHHPHSSSQREAYVPPASGGKKEGVPQASGQKDNHHSPAHTQNENRPSQAPNQIDHRSSQAPTRNEDHPTPVSDPNEHSADDSLETIEARMKAFEEEERVRQKQHEEELAQKKRQQRTEFEHELEEKINQKKRDADLARRAAVQKQEEEHEERLAELRRR